MSLIRNGGFERGTTDFWEVESGGTLEVDDSNQKYGNYCGKFTVNTLGYPVVLSSDYIDVKPYQIVDTIMYLKSAASYACRSLVHYYDADYSLIKTSYGNLISMNGSYIEFTGQFTVPVGAAYIRFGFYIMAPGIGDVFYIDSVGLEIIDAQSSLSGIVELLPYDYYTTSADTFSSAKSIEQFSIYFVELYCSGAYGTSPTLDVVVKEVNWQGQKCHLADFSTVTTAGDYRIDLPYALGNQMYIEYTIGGTDPEFDFGVAVIGKR